MKDIAIYGAGGLGKEVACLIDRINELSSSEDNKYQLLGFFDDSVKKGTKLSCYGEVLGGMDELNQWKTPLCVSIAIGSPHSLEFVQKRIVNPNITFPNLIHPDFKVADRHTFTIGQGNIIQGDCFGSCDVTLGSFNVLNGSVVIGHDTKIGDYNVIMPNIRISGQVTIGDANLLGIGSIILQQMKIGTGVRLGAGAVLMTKPKNGGTYIGNPAKLLKY